MKDDVEELLKELEQKDGLKKGKKPRATRRNGPAKKERKDSGSKSIGGFDFAKKNSKIGRIVDLSKLPPDVMRAALITFWTAIINDGEGSPLSIRKDAAKMLQELYGLKNKPPEEEENVSPEAIRDAHETYMREQYSYLKAKELWKIEITGPNGENSLGYGAQPAEALEDAQNTLKKQGAGT